MPLVIQEREMVSASLWMYNGSVQWRILYKCLAVFQWKTREIIYIVNSILILACRKEGKLTRASRTCTKRSWRLNCIICGGKGLSHTSLVPSEIFAEGIFLSYIKCSSYFSVVLSKCIWHPGGVSIGKISIASVSTWVPGQRTVLRSSAILSW